VHGLGPEDVVDDGLPVHRERGAVGVGQLRARADGELPFGEPYLEPSGAQAGEEVGGGHADLSLPGSSA
jgi:hypothetical protein